MGVVIDGKLTETPGLRTTSWLENPALAILTPEDGRERTGPWRVRQVVLHTTKGIPGGTDHRMQVIKPGLGVFTNVGERSAAYCRNNPDSRPRKPGDKIRSVNGGHHLTVDFDGSISCHMDLASVSAYHARSLNRFSIGIEMLQGKDAELYEDQLDVVVKLVDFLTRSFGIQRQVHYVGRCASARAWTGPINRLGPAKWGQDSVGVFGHRDGDSNRGLGDPGDEIFERLISAGYERFDFSKDEDKYAWKPRQMQLSLAADGVPGPGTVRALKSAGYAHGLWISREGD